ncbi:hypothetical protein [Streptococcus australis]|jgi:hypothetical protein|uniref:hypothetical protein n=2 Tax=Streptococcus australis TaxID=113107 RepID=UPI0023301FAA|nr:hypothetical protein [Streptococcus australis]MDB8645603.1 hypothetical protein [Streptococcus australis]
MVKDYRELRKRYNIPVIVLLVILALPFLYIVHVTQSKNIATICFLIYLMMELVLAIIKDTLLIKKLYNLIYEDINLDLMASYILTQKRKSIKTIKVRVLIAILFYYYRIGDFGSIEAVAKELKQNQKFTDVEQVTLNEILLNANLFSRLDLKEDEFEELLANYLADDESLKMAYRARYDILVKKEANDAILKEVKTTKFSQLESIYLRAVNEYLKGNRNKARELFATIAKEDERLYLVRMAQAYLGSENSGGKSVSLDARQEEVTVKLLRLKLVEEEPVKRDIAAKSNKGLAFFRGWKIALLLIPPFLMYAIILSILAVLKKIGSFLPKKFKMGLLLLIPVAMIIFYIKQEQEMNAVKDGRYYLVVKSKSSNKASIDKSTWVEFSGDYIILKEGNTTTTILYNSEDRSFEKDGIIYRFTDDHGDLSISDMVSHESVSYVSTESSMFPKYEIGK